MSMNKLRGLVMFAALGFGALAGCGGVEESAAPDMASVEQDLLYCQDNSGCPSGQSCINSACRPTPPGGRACGKMDPATGEMSNTTYCTATQICCLNTGTCVSNYNQCAVP
ncbi:hypothetical protein [Corallococcus carmarthensis]|uniref:Uncharacterized protein n=1 Tax=Corallococcus carmarthensis TaxID=2316728 RepID=A0A3A8K714_9BACT|nr:hypothetical protein [Corallococcus carmarthensis]NOK17896.1 hypothetical protein [Corallococcus carmarthensis]RKH03933.1 hypothetical protein D7X32_12480 [Corallococcus carmarthensis]